MKRVPVQRIIHDRAVNEGTKLWKRIQTHPRVDKTWVELECGIVSYFAALRPGWIGGEGTHCVMGQTQTAVARDLRDLEPCACSDCVGAL